MRNISEKELKYILDRHGKWLRDEEGGEWKISTLLGNEYWVSNLGSIASMFNPCGSLRKVPHILSQNKSTNGYKTIRFKGKHILVHRVVANEFIGPVVGKIVHHKNGIRFVNHMANLEITSISNNNKHGFKTRKLNKKIITEMIRYYRSEK